MLSPLVLTSCSCGTLLGSFCRTRAVNRRRSPLADLSSLPFLILVALGRCEALMSIMQQHILILKRRLVSRLCPRLSRTHAKFCLYPTKWPFAVSEVLTAVAMKAPAFDGPVLASAIY